MTATQPHAQACAKVRFPTLGSAQQNLYHILSIQDPGRVKPVRVYPCDRCDAWHLTSRPLHNSVDLTAPSTVPLLIELDIYESVEIARAARLVLDGRAAAADPGAVRALRDAGLVELDDDLGTVCLRDLANLHLSAGNLETLEDGLGNAIEPSRWLRHPQVPVHLRAVQASITAAGRAGFDRRVTGTARAVRPDAVPVPTQRPKPVGASPATLAAIAAVRAAATRPAVDPVAQPVPTRGRWAAFVAFLRSLSRGQRRTTPPAAADGTSAGNAAPATPTE